MQKCLLQIFRHCFICIATVKSVQSWRLLQNILSNYFYWNAFVNPKRKKLHVKFVVPKLQENVLLHKKSCSAGTLYCTQCPTFSTKSQNGLIYHIAKKHSAPKDIVNFKCKLCYQEFPVFLALRQHRNTQHRMQIGSGTRDVNVEHIVEDIEDHGIREDLRCCQHFLVDSELERARHKVFTYAVETLDETVVNEKLDQFFNKMNFARKANEAFAFILKKIKNGGFRYFYVHENNTLLARSELVCTHDDLEKLKDFLNKTEVIESCSWEGMDTEWTFYKLTNLTVFGVLLKGVPMGCKNAVLREPSA